MNSIESTNALPIKQKNLYEELKNNQFRSPIETSRKNINSDISNSNTVFNLENNQRSRNFYLSTKKINQNNERKIRPYTSLQKNINYKDFDYSKKKFSPFYRDTKHNYVFLKQMKKDNHFSSQNFRLKKSNRKIRIPLTTKLIRNKSINNTRKENKYFQPILISNFNNNDNSYFHKKVGKKVKILKNKYSQSVKRMKYYNKKIETHKNFESKIEIPLMIIRNVSLHSPK